MLQDAYLFTPKFPQVFNKSMPNQSNNHHWSPGKLIKYLAHQTKKHHVGSEAGCINQSGNTFLGFEHSWLSYLALHSPPIHVLNTQQSSICMDSPCFHTKNIISGDGQVPNNNFRWWPVPNAKFNPPRECGWLWLTCPAHIRIQLVSAHVFRFLWNQWQHKVLSKLAPTSSVVDVIPWKPTSTHLPHVKSKQGSNNK